MKPRYSISFPESRKKAEDDREGKAVQKDKSCELATHKVKGRNN